MNMETILYVKYSAMVGQIARLTTSAEYIPSDPDDATATLDRLIAEARELTGIEGPEEVGRCPVCGGPAYAGHEVEDGDEDGHTQ